MQGAQPGSSELTRREREVVRLTAEGLSGREVAVRLSRSPRTIENHLRSAYSKLGVRNRVEMVRRVQELGMFSAAGDARRPGVLPASELEIKGRALDGLQSLYQRLAIADHDAYFQALAAGLAEVFGLRWAGIAEVTDDPNILEVIVHSGESAPTGPIECRDRACPCRKVLEIGEFVVRSGSAATCPCTRPAAGKPAHSFAGVRLDDRMTGVVGVLWVMHDREIPENLGVLEALRVVARRAAAELALARVLDGQTTHAPQPPTAEEPGFECAERQRTGVSMSHQPASTPPPAPPPPPLRLVHASLTRREHEVVRLAAAGLSGREMAVRLSRSPRTIENHLRAVYQKLGVRNRVEMLRAAQEQHLLGDPMGSPPNTALELKGRALEALHRVSARLAHSENLTFFGDVAIALCHELGIRWAGISEATPQDRVLDIIVVADRGELTDQIQCPIEVSPCALALRDGVCDVPRELAARFPDDEIIRLVGAECYLGVRLDDRLTGPIGVLWVMDDSPAHDPFLMQQVLSILAPRTAAELALARALDDPGNAG